MASSLRLTDYTQEVLRQRDRMWEQDLVRNLEEIQAGRLAARLAEISLSPSGREAARTATALSAALPPQEVALRLRLLGVDERWANAQVNGIWPTGISLQAGRRHYSMIGPGAAEELACSFPEMSVLWTRAYNVGPSQAGQRGVDVTHQSPSGTFPSEWSFSTIPPIPPTVSLTSARAQYFISAGSGMGWSNATVTDVTGVSRSCPNLSYQIVEFSWNTMLTWVENQIGRIACAGTVGFQVTSQSTVNIRCGCYRLILEGQEC